MKAEIVKTIAERIRMFVGSNPEILSMTDPGELLVIEGLVLADISPSRSLVAAALSHVQAEFA